LAGGMTADDLRDLFEAELTQQAGANGRGHE
jgi:hypothetical protein